MASAEFLERFLARMLLLLGVCGAVRKKSYSLPFFYFINIKISNREKATNYSTVMDVHKSNNKLHYIA